MSRAGQSDSFPPTTYANWRMVVERSRESEALASRLRASATEPLPVEPLYAPGGPGDVDARNLAGRVASLMGTHASWRIRQAFALGTTLGDVQDALSGGMDSLELVAPDGATAAELREAAARHARADLELSFQGIDPALVVPGFLGRREGTLSIGFDPIGRALTSRSLHDLGRQLAALEVHARAGCQRLVRADGTTVGWPEPGVGLGRTISVALAYLRAIEDAGLELPEAARCIEVRVPCEARFFQSIALLRAARLVWARILEVAGLHESPALCLVASAGPSALPASASPMLDAQPWTGALRNSVVAFAAAAGGADVVHLHPGAQLESMTASGPRRLACTTALIAREESYLRRVVDPSEGSWYLESMTARFAGSAWQEIARLDAAGGIVAAMRNGIVVT